MKYSEFDRDETLTNFLIDYIDGKMGHAECEAFEEYLAQNADEQQFAQKALMGQRVLARFARHLNVPRQVA